MPVLLRLRVSRAGNVAMLGGGVLLVFGVQEVRLKSAQHGEAAAKATLQAEQTAETARERAAAQISAEAQVHAAQEQVRIQTVTKTLLQKVPIYVPAAADADCVV